MNLERQFLFAMLLVLPAVAVFWRIGDAPEQGPVQTAIPEPMVQPVPLQPAAEMPAEAPEPMVAWHDGLLTIHAQDADLAQLLGAIGTATGARIDARTPVDGVHVAADVGPGRPRDVLAALLDSTSFGYLLVALPRQPDTITRIVLLRDKIARPTATTTPAPAAAPPRDQVIEMQQQQQRQMNGMFQDCKTQGCDAS